MNVTGDMLADAMTDFLGEFVSSSPGARMLHEGHATAAMSGLPWPTLNSVWPRRTDADPADVAKLLDEIAASDLPFALVLRPGDPTALADVATARGMTPVGEVPVMAADTALDVRLPDGLSIRLLAPSEAPVFIRLFIAGFEFPVEVVERMVTEDILKNDSVRCYVGEIDGQPVATGMSVTTGAYTGLTNITTLPEYRGRGIGTAITARAVADGLAAGASWSWLMSSDDGYHLYASYGFQTIESWQFWISALRTPRHAQLGRLAEHHAAHPHRTVEPQPWQRAYRRQRRLGFQPRQVRADAEVRAVGERQVPDRVRP
jgi:N-acetylglutamate synthase